MSYFDMYLFTRLDNLQALFKMIATAVGLGVLMLAMFSDTNNYLKDHWGKLTAGFIMFVLLAVLTPTQKEAAAIFIVPKIVNNERIQNMAGNTVEILERQTAEYLRGIIKQKVAEATGGK